MPSGERVSVEGIPTPSLRCTAKMCERGEVCCKGCGGGYVVRVGNGQVRLLGLSGCTGMDCNYRCEPFGIRRPSRFVGRPRRYDAARFVLDGNASGIHHISDGSS